MSEDQQPSRKPSVQDQDMLAEREARRSEMMHRNLDYGDVRGITAMVIWIIVVVLLFAAMYFLSGE